MFHLIRLFVYFFLMLFQNVIFKAGERIVRPVRRQLRLRSTHHGGGCPLGRATAADAKGLWSWYARGL